MEFILTIPLPAPQVVYLQFRDKDKWMTVQDFNPSINDRLHLYDDRVREYINLELLNLKVSYSDTHMQARFKNDPDLLIRGEVSNRLRLAIRTNNQWIYVNFVW